MKHPVTPLSVDNNVLNDSNYDPNRLIDALLVRTGVKNDAALARLLEVAPPVISKIRHRRVPVGPAVLLRIHETTELPVRELRALMVPVQAAAA